MPKEFDLRTHIIDPKTGTLLKYQPYSMSVSRDGGTIFTRGGIRYYPNGDPVDAEAHAPAPALPTEARLLPQQEKGKHAGKIPG